jgi:predicted phosphoribosyltransferase
MPFSNRRAAGVALARSLETYRDQQPVVLALPRGGVPVAVEVARALNAPLDLVFARKVGVPGQPELAMGAVVDGKEPIVVRNEDVVSALGIGEAAFRAVCDRELAEIARRRTRYLGKREPIELAGRTAILVDDGIATGATTRAALRSLRLRRPRRLVLATPVAPADTLQALAGEADEIVCLESYVSFGSIGAWYDDFSQLTDEEVVALIGMVPAAGTKVGA